MRLIYPFCQMNSNAEHRICVINRNVPNMVAQITQVLGDEHVNIVDMINRSRGDFGLYDGRY